MRCMYFGALVQVSCSDRLAALTDADALIVVTEWAEFKIPKFTFIEKALKHKIIFDGRNIYSPEQMKEFGYMYYGIGRKDN